MEIKESVSLSNYSTMALGGTTKYLTTVNNKNELVEALKFAKEKSIPFIVVGNGSNIIWKDEGFSGLLIVNNILQYDVFQEDETNFYITIGAGENWDSVVERTVSMGLTGIEALSLIPGKAGATPIQNVGAYGQDISQTLTTIEALDSQSSDYVLIPGSDCSFGYRTSRFKTVDKNRFLISSITLHLIKGDPAPPFYISLQSYLDEHHVTTYTPSTIRQAVIDIRSSKLPNVNEVHNCGSFFANPIVSESEFYLINQEYDMIPNWQLENNYVKLSAAWLIEQCGFKDNHDNETGMATWHNHSLVLVNEFAKNTADLLVFKNKIVDAVKEKFNITLEQEPELLP